MESIFSFSIFSPRFRGPPSLRQWFVFPKTKISPANLNSFFSIQSEVSFKSEEEALTQDAETESGGIGVLELVLILKQVIGLLVECVCITEKRKAPYSFKCL